MNIIKRTIGISACFALVLLSVFWHERVPGVIASETTDVFTSSGIWTAPAGVTSVDVECWGGGGSGGSRNSGFNGGGGGGGGVYAKKTEISVTPGNNYTITVGAGGAAKTATSGGINGDPGGDSSFDAGADVLAKGGLGGSGTDGTGGIGGTAAASVGDTKFSGGNGGPNQGNFAGGGGGGGAGDAANGSNAGNELGANGGSVGGGKGGNGGGPIPPGGTLAGATFGAGGGGRQGGGDSGAGARGECRVTYTFPPPPPPEFTPQGILYGDGTSTTLSAEFLVWDDTSRLLGVGTSTPRNALEVIGTAAARHMKGLGESPSISEGSCAGSGGSSSVSGTDMAGEITLNTGTAPAGSSECVRVTFVEAYDSAPRVTFSPSNENAGLMAGIAPVYVQSTTSTFSLYSTVGLLGSTTYQWTYQVIE